MKKGSIIFLQAVIVLIGVGTMVFLLWEPHLEGRNVNATAFEIYFKDPFLAYAYVASVPFFVGLYQAFKMLRFAGQNDEVFSGGAVKSLRTIKYCAMIIIGFVVVSVAFIPFTDGGDDGPQGVMMRVVVTFGSIVVATGAAILERIFRKAADMKSENDLTV